MEPPIQATILIFMEAGARALISFSLLRVGVNAVKHSGYPCCREHGVAVFLADEVGLEEHLGAAEVLVAGGDALIIRQLIVLLKRLGNLGHFLQENLHQKEEQHETT